MTDFKQDQLQKLELGRVTEISSQNKALSQQQGRLFALQKVANKKIDKQLDDGIFSRSSRFQLDKDIHTIASNTFILKDINITLEKLLLLQSKSLSPSVNLLGSQNLNIDKHITSKSKPASKLQNALLGAAGGGIVAKSGIGTAGLGLALGSKGVIGSTASGLLSTLGPAAGGALPLILLGSLLGSSKGSFKDRLSSNFSKLKDKSNQTSKSLGITLSQNRLLTTPGKFLLRQFGSDPHEQKIGLQIVNIDLLRTVAGELVSIRRHGFDISDTLLLRRTKSKVSVIKKLDAIISSIVGIGDVFTSLKTIIAAPFKFASSVKKLLDKLFTISGGIDEQEILKKAGLSLSQKERSEISQEQLPQLLEDLKRVNIQQLEVQENIYLLLNNLTKVLTGTTSKFVSTRKDEKEKRVFDIFSGRFETKKENEITESRRKDILTKIIEKERGIVTSILSSLLKNKGAKSNQELTERVLKFAPNQRGLQFRTEQEEVEEKTRPHGARLFFTKRGREELKSRFENELFLFREIFKHRVEEAEEFSLKNFNEKDIDLNKLDMNGKSNLSTPFQLWFDKFENFQQQLFERFDKLITCSCCSCPEIGLPKKSDADSIIEDFNKMFNDRHHDGTMASVIATSPSPISELKNNTTIGDQIENTINDIFQNKTGSVTGRLEKRKEKQDEKRLVTSNEDIREGIKQLVELEEDNKKKTKKKGLLGSFLGFLGTGIANLFKSSAVAVTTLLSPLLLGVTGAISSLFTALAISIVKPAVLAKFSMVSLIGIGVYNIVSSMIDGWKEEGIIGSLKGLFSTDNSIFKGMTKYGAIGAAIAGMIGGPVGVIAGGLLGAAIGGIISVIGDDAFSKTWDGLISWIFENVTKPIMDFIHRPFEMLKRLLGISTEEIQEKTKDERLSFYRFKQKKILEKIAISSDDDEKKNLSKRLHVIGKEISVITSGNEKKIREEDLIKKQKKESLMQRKEGPIQKKEVAPKKEKTLSFFDQVTTPNSKFRKTLSSGLNFLNRGLDKIVGTSSIDLKNFKKPKDLSTTQKGIDLISKLENSNNLLQVYNDQGTPAIGYGHNKTSKDTFDFDQTGYVDIDSNKVKVSKFSLQDAKRLLRNDVKKAEKIIQSAVTHPISQPMFDSLTSLAYNTGPSLFFDSKNRKKIAPKLLSALNSGNFDVASQEIMDINKSKGKFNSGLDARRKIESELFSSVNKQDLDTLNQQKPIINLDENLSIDDTTIANASNQSEKLLAKLDNLYASNIKLISSIFESQNNKPVVLPQDQNVTNDDTITNPGLTQFSPIQDKIVKELFTLTPVNLMFSLNQASGREDYNLFPI